jgi:DNA polymerase-3 subunit alpha
MGIRILPPDINESDYPFTVPAGGRGPGPTSETTEAIRFGLGAVKGVGEGAIEVVLAARRRLGRFRSLAHLACEIDGRLVNRKVFECLIKAGAFDNLGVDRAALWSFLDRALDYGQRRRQEREMGQGSLFGGAFGGSEESLEPAPDPATPPWPERERLRYEKESLGFYLTGNPLSEHAEVLGRLVTHTTVDLREGYEGPATLGGMVNGVRQVKIKSGPNAGRFMGRFVLDDSHGFVPVTLFANQMQQFGHLLHEEAVVLVKGDVRERGSEPEMTVEELIPLERLAGKSLAGIELLLEPTLSTADMLKLKNLLLEHPGSVPVTLRLKLTDRTVSIAAKETYKIELSPALSASIEGLLGQGKVLERFTPAGAG